MAFATCSPLSTLRTTSTTSGEGRREFGSCPGAGDRDAPAGEVENVTGHGGHVANAGSFDSAASRLENHTHAVNRMAEAEKMVITVPGTKLT